MGLPHTPSGPSSHARRITDPALQECSFRQCKLIGFLGGYLTAHQLSKCRVHLSELLDSSSVFTEHPQLQV
eukprot:2367045-Lingulodinium_polyedra.AAC.1